MIDAVHIYDEEIQEPQSIWQEVLAEQAEQERNMMFRHNWVPLTYNWVIAFTAMLLIIALAGWRIQKHAEIRDEAIRTEARAEWDAERQAEADAENEKKEQEARSYEAFLQLEKQYCGKALYGIHLFVEKYHYDELDLKTYLRSAFNRVDELLQGKDFTEEERAQALHDVLFGGQYLACKEDNPALKEYEDVSEESLLEWHAETTKPVDLKYQFAELTESGIYLKNDINADGYARRWHA